MKYETGTLTERMSNLTFLSEVALATSQTSQHTNEQGIRQPLPFSQPVCQIAIVTNLMRVYHLR